MSTDKELRYDRYLVPPLLRTPEVYFLLDTAYSQLVPSYRLDHVWDDDVLWVKIHMVRNKIIEEKRRFLENGGIVQGDWEFIYYKEDQGMYRLAECALYYLPPVPALHYYLDMLLSTTLPLLFDMDLHDSLVSRGGEFNLAARR